MSLLGFLTGGKSGQAEAALDEAQRTLSAVKAPSIQELTLPQLQQYVQAGILTPEQAQAVLVQKNAFDNISTSSKPVEAEMSALSKMQDIADSGGLDAQAKNKIAQAQNNAQITAQGQRGSIIDQMAARGIPTSLISEAMQHAAVGQDAQTQMLADTQAASDAEQRALAALSESGTLGGQIHGQEYSEAANKAQAANAIAQWNAQNQTATNEQNTSRLNTAQLLNLQTKQNAMNANTQTGNQRTAYNANLPQQVYNNAMQKAQASANISGQKAGLYTGQGKQNAQIVGGLTGLGVTTLFGGNQAGQGGADAGGGGGGGGAFPGSAMGYGAGSAGSGAAAYESPEAAAMVLAGGGKIPGKADVPGDNPRNDKVPAMLSPGEVVIPRTIASNPDLARQFVAHVMRNKVPVKPVHHEDVKTMLDALTARREAA